MPSDPGLSPPLSDLLAALRRRHNAWEAAADRVRRAEPSSEEQDDALERFRNADDALCRWFRQNVAALLARLPELQAAAEALEPFARFADACDERHERHPDAVVHWDIAGETYKIRAGDCRQAREVLARLRSAAGEGKGGET